MSGKVLSSTLVAWFKQLQTRSDLFRTIFLRHVQNISTALMLGVELSSLNSQKTDILSGYAFFFKLN